MRYESQVIGSFDRICSLRVFYCYCVLMQFVGYSCRCGGMADSGSRDAGIHDMEVAKDVKLKADSCRCNK